MIPTGVLGGISSFVISICCALAAYFLYSPKRKLSQEEAFYLLFWVFGSLWWLTTSFVLGLKPFFPEISGKLLYLSGVWLGFHIIFAPFYIVAKITKRFWIKAICGISLLLFLGYYLFYFLPKMKPLQEVPYPYYNVPGNIPHGYFMGAFVLVFSGFALYLIWLDWRTGKISLGNLAPFYKFYAGVIYGAISLPKVLYVLKTSWFLDIFYLFIPYLMYLARKNKIKTCQQSLEE
jgi:hypothetical protein